MASYTIREFTEAVGLGKDRDSVIRSGIILKALCGLGIARETGTKKHGSGRPAAVYEVPDPIVIPLELGQQVLAQKAPVATAVAKPVVEQEPVSVAAPQGSYSYDYDEDED